MKTKNWKQLAEEFKNLAHTNYEPAQVNVVITKDFEGKPDGLEVYPKQGNSLHVINEIVDFCRCKLLSNCVSIDLTDGKPVLCARIF